MDDNSSIYLNKNKEHQRLLLNSSFEIIANTIPPNINDNVVNTKNKKHTPFVSLFIDDFKENIINSLIHCVKNLVETDCEAIFASNNQWVLIKSIPVIFEKHVLVEIFIYNYENLVYKTSEKDERSDYAKNIVKIGSMLTPSRNLSLSITNAMRLILETIDLHVLAIYRDMPEEEMFVIDKLVTADSAKEQIQNESILPYYNSLIYKKILEQHRLIVAESVDDPISALTRSHLEAMNIRSFIVVPIFITGKFYGGLLAGCNSNKRWNSHEVDFIHAVSLMVGQSIDRNIIYQQIRARRNDFVNMFNIASDMVFIINIHGYVIEANTTATKTMGYSRRELLEKNINEITTISKEVESSISDEMQQSRQLIFGTSLIKKDGTSIPIEVREKFITYNNKKCILAIVRDITERKHFDRLIMQTMIDTEDKERKRFAEALHDDLGPLLSALKIYVDLFACQKLDPKRDISEVQQMRQIIEQAIQTSKQTAINLMPNILVDFGLIEAISDFINKINTTKTIEIKFDNQTKKLLLKENTEKILFGIIKELVNNTIKHSQAKHARLTLSQTNNYLELKYSDNGIGYNFHKEMREEKKGMGLQNIFNKIDSLGGFIVANDNSTIILTIPL